MTYSKTHKRFAGHLNNQRALEHPEDYLGSNWKDVLNFWWFLDGLSEDQWEIVRQRYWALDYKVRDAARFAARFAAAWNGADAADAAYSAAFDAAWDVAGEAAAYATYELIGSHILLEQGKSLVFLPLFSNID
jgi:hypothetical protein